MDELPAPHPLADGARLMAGTAVDLIHTRLQLATVELEEERLRLARQAAGALWAGFFGGLALVLACAWLTLASPPDLRLWVLAALGGAAGLIAGLLARRWQRIAAARPPLLSATLAELRADAQALSRGLQR